MSLAVNPDDPASKLIREAWTQMYVDVDVAARLSEQALNDTALNPRHPCRGEAWFLLSFACLRASRRDDAMRAIANARAHFDECGDQRGLLLCDEIDAFCVRLSGKREAALAMQLRIAQRTDVVRPAVDRFISHNWRSFTRKHLGQTDEMLLDSYQSLTAAESVDYPGPRMTALINLGVAHKDLFNLDEATELLEQGLDMAEAAKAWNAVSIASFHLIYTYEGLSLPGHCASLLERLWTHEHEIPAAVLHQNAPSLAIGHLCAGNLVSARHWLKQGAGAAFGDGDGKTDFARAAAHYFIEKGANQRARKIVERRIAEIERRALHDPPYARMRLLRAGNIACERLDDSKAALAYLHKAQALYETLLARNFRARFIALQVSHELIAAKAERDQARLAQEQAELHFIETTQLNLALQARIEEAARLAQALKAKVAEAENLQSVLREQAIRDPLTGLFNRRFLSEVGAARVSTARRRQIELAIVLLDIDHFKHVNDSFGHAIGDAVLMRFAVLLSDRFRSSDTLCRFGGEEFLVLVEACSEKDLGEALRGLMDNMFEQRFGSGKMAFGSLTFSAGVAMLGTDGTEFEALVKIADDRMYTAKAGGRARIVGTTGQLTAD